MVIANKLVKKLAATTLVVAASLFGATSMAAETVGFVYVSPIGDAGWTYQHDLGRLQME